MMIPSPQIVVQVDGPESDPPEHVQPDSGPVQSDLHLVPGVSDERSSQASIPTQSPS